MKYIPRERKQLTIVCARSNQATTQQNQPNAKWCGCVRARETAVLFRWFSFISIKLGKIRAFSHKIGAACTHTLSGVRAIARYTTFF